MQNFIAKKGLYESLLPLPLAEHHHHSKLTQVQQLLEMNLKRIRTDKAGEKLLRIEVNDHLHQGSEGGAKGPYKTPLSPTTHTLVLPNNDNSLNHQRETFV